jgi:hypothetical protein
MKGSMMKNFLHHNLKVKRILASLQTYFKFCPNMMFTMCEVNLKLGYNMIYLLHHYVNGFEVVIIIIKLISKFEIHVQVTYLEHIKLQLL